MEKVCGGEVVRWGPCVSGHCPRSAPWPAAWNCTVRIDIPSLLLGDSHNTSHVSVYFGSPTTSGMCWLVLD